jgi:serine/threonine-protein kinase
MGEVFLAEDTSLGRQVALKVMTASDDDSVDDDRSRRFLQEARLASALSHPNIAQIFEIGEAGTVKFIAMEYVAGDPLSTRIQRGPLASAEVIDIALQLFDALEEAHTKDIIHRDLKPANIMLTDRGRVKILDFGLAKRLEPAATPDQATLLTTDRGVVMGTIQYMSPEQALGRKVDARTDLFSAGVVLYELLTARLPFLGASTTDTLHRIVNAQPDAISRLNYGAPPELERIVKKALEKEPARRYQSARDVLIDLRNFKRDSDSDVSGPVARKAKARKKSIDSIAVVPLAATISSAEIEYLADGITESLIDALSQLPKLRVLARSTVFRYKGRQPDPQDIGRELGVRAALLGRLQVIGDRLLTRVELVDTEDGSHLWGGQFQHATTDVLALEGDLSREIAEQLRLRLTRDDRKRLQKKHTENARANEAYMRGRFQLAKRTNEGFTKAVECFRQAIAEDPRYALAHAGLADCYTLLGTAAYVAAPAGSSKLARDAAERAIALDDQLAEAHSALGFVRFRVDWDWAGAEVSLKRACELNPGHAPAHHRYALLLSALGRPGEAIAEIRRAYELDPLSLIIGTAYGRVLHFARRYDEAIAQLRRTLEMDPAFQQAHFDLGMAFAQAGRHDDALAELESQLDRGDRRSILVAVMGNTLAMAGQPTRARAILDDLRQGRSADQSPSAELAYVLAGLGELDEAMRMCEAACDARVGVAVFFKVEPMLDPLRAHPRFNALLQRLRLDR